MLASPSEDERAAVDDLLGEPTSGWHGAERDEVTHRVARGGRAAREQRDLLLPALHALQSRVGWISQGGLNYVSERLTVPPAEAYGVATFYAMFSVQPRAKIVVHACDDLACRMSGGELVCDALQTTFGEPGAEGEVTWVRSPCLGMCERAPVALVQTSGEGAQDATFGQVDPRQVQHLVTKTLAGQEFSRPTDPQVSSAPQTWDADGRAALRLLRRVGAVDPASIDDYRAHHGYEALRRAIELGPEETLREITDAKLLGRGGAAFPTGVKWKAVAEQLEHPHFFICNADESEPGTFKDRVVMESDPYAVVEALTIAGVTTGCAKGYVYIRGEYPLATSRLEHALTEARRHGFLGADIMGHGIDFDIEVRRGAGAYICGEETALFNSLEGKRGEPRNKPPFPVQRGLFGKPTGINNVETLINVLEVLRIGSQAYAELGSEGSTGTRLFCVAGSVASPGVYEAEHGITLGEVLDAGGRRGRPPQGGAVGRRGGRLRGPGPSRHPAHVRRRARRWLHAGLGRGAGDEPGGRPGRRLPADRAVLPRRVVRPMRALPGGDRPPGGGAAPPRERPHDRFARRRDGPARRRRPGDARCLDLRARPDGGQRGAVRHRRARRVRRRDGTAADGDVPTPTEEQES